MDKTQTSYVNLDSLDIEKFTPVMRQYLNARLGLGDKAILFFRMGDFYEAFFNDAALIARELDITLTGRSESNYPGGRIPMAGVPQKAVMPYIAKLLEKGYRVCIAEQMADPKTCKGLVPREITKTYTPGTIDELNLLNSSQNNFIAAIYQEKKDPSSPLGLAYADISTGEFYLTQIQAKYLEQELTRIKAVELLIPSSHKKLEGDFAAREVADFDFPFLKQYFITLSDNKNFKAETAQNNISQNFSMKSLDSISIDSFSLGIQAAGAIIEYIKETQIENCQIDKNFESITTYQVSDYLLIDSNTRRNLELVRTLKGEKQGSLLSCIDRTCSNPGKRRLSSWLEQPLYDKESINNRLDTVTELLEASCIHYDLNYLLDQVYDLDRLANRLATEKINPKEMISLKTSLVQLTQIASLMQDLKSNYLAPLQHIPDCILDSIREIELAILDNPSMTITEGGIFKSGFNTELDEYIMLVEDSNSWLKAYEESEREKLGVKNLKVNFNKVHGYFIETSRLNAAKLPENEYVCKQTMVNSARFITTELKEFEDKITNAEVRRNNLEHKLYTDLKRKLNEHAPAIKLLANHAANLDALFSLAKIALENNYVRPILNESTDLNIQDGRHPVVESMLNLGQFVPNDIKQNDNSKIMILTGPNMAGKSTFMRQNALIIILAQMGSYVPANHAEIGLVDRIFTRIGASDDLASGQSTFMVEMTETAAILNGVTPKSFVVLDEIGRGTSTYDGVSIAWSIVEYLSKNHAARTIFATHYHELANLDKMFDNIENFQMLVSETGSGSSANVEFLHRVAPGSANRSYGIEVAKLAGLPKDVLTRARSINNQLQTNRSEDLNKMNKKFISANKKDAADISIDALPLFAQP